MTERKRRPERQPLGIKCTSTNCSEGLHCFLPAPRARRNRSQSQTPGTCWECGANLVDWQRIHKRDLTDVSHTFTSLKYELIRHHFWHEEVDQKTLNHALRKGLGGLRADAEHRIRKYLASPVLPGQPTFDGRQTPYRGNIIYYAQHATATCCRKCLEAWYAIPRNHELTDEQLAYFTELLMLFIQEKLPELPHDGQHVPRTRKSARRTRSPEGLAE